MRATVTLLIAILLAPAALAEDALDPAAYPGLVWHAEKLDGTEVTSHDADRSINPASVVKVATTLWALRDLGAATRFETRFLIDGELGPDGVLDGNLVIDGGADPDFHLENAFHVAISLRERGVERVTGALVVHQPFWLGWEGGAEKRLPDPADRAQLMAVRLRSVFDPHRWPRSTQRAWRKFAAEHDIARKETARIVIEGGVEVGDGPVTGRPLIVHRSKPTSDVLRRFNCWSNNDIDRLEVRLGTPDDLATLLKTSWGETAATGVQFATTSGLGENRMTPRQIVRLLQDLDRESREDGLEPQSVLPVAGCDPGTLENFFPTLNSDAYAGTVVGKTGSLVYTDRGVSAFAGIARTATGDIAFAAIYPRAGRRMHWARRMEERLVVDLIDAAGGPSPRACQPAPPGPEDGAAVFDAGRDAVLVAAPR